MGFTKLYQEINLQLKVSTGFRWRRGWRSMNPGRRREMVDREHRKLPIVPVALRG